MYFSFANVFFPSKFPHIRQCLSRFVQCGSRKDIHCYSKICKAKIEFFVNIRMTRNSEKNTNKSYCKTAARNDPGNNTKKIVTLILQNAMPKATNEVYFELLVTNFYTQISFSCHSKFVKIIFILMHRISITVFVYMSFPAATKMFWLVTCPTNSG